MAATTKGEVVRIQLDDKFTLNVDRWNYFITKKFITGETAKNPGGDYDRAYGGYFTSFTDCMKNFVRKQPQFAEVKSISALMKCEKDGQEKVAEWCEELDSAFKIMQKDKKFAPLLKELGKIMAENSKK